MVTLFPTRWRNRSHPVNIIRPANSSECKFIWTQDGAVVLYNIQYVAGTTACILDANTLLYTGDLIMSVYTSNFEWK